MQVDADRALLAALQSYRVVVAAFKSIDRVQWVDSAMALLVQHGQIDPPSAWNIYEPHLVRDALAKMIQAVERYNADKENQQ